MPRRHGVVPDAETSFGQCRRIAVDEDNGHVLAAGEKESGCTIHLVNGECDGGRILIQKKVPVMPGDDPDSLYARIAPQEHEAIVEGLLMLCK